MTFQDYLAETLLDLAHAVYVKPTMEDLCQFLATRMCPSGETSRVYVGRLDPDGIIRTEGSFGYSIDTKIGELETSIEVSRPMPRALKKREVYVANWEEVLRDFRDYTPFDQRSPWVATAVVPTLGRHVFVFRLQCQIKEKESVLLYFKAAGALLSFFDFGATQTETRLIAKPRLQTVLRGQKLSPRQSEILNLIIDRKTNSHIANALAYSESLIKQETIIIYAKLGVRGRQEILHSVNFEDRMNAIN